MKLTKQCPKCKRTYDGDLFTFCLDDGALLSPPRDPDATLIMNPPLTGRKLVVLSVTPKTRITSGTLVTCTGRGFETIKTILLEKDPVEFVVLSATELSITMPPHAQGLADVVVNGIEGVAVFSLEYS